MSIQDIFADEPMQQGLDEQAGWYGRIWIAALKAASGVVDEVNRAEPPPPAPPEHPHPETKVESGDKDDEEPEDDEEEPEHGPIMGDDDVMHIATEIYKGMLQQILMAQAMPSPPAAPSQPAASKRRIAVRAPESEEPQ